MDNAKRLLRLPDVIGDRKRGIPGRIPMSCSRWYAGIRSGNFPAAIHIGGCAFWTDDMIDQIIKKAS